MPANSGVSSRMGHRIVPLSTGQAATSRALADILVVSARTAQRYLHALEAKGLVLRQPYKGESPGRSVLWVRKGVDDVGKP